MHTFTDDELAAHDAQVRAEAWDEGCAAGLDKGLDIADLRSGPIDLTKVPPPPVNPYRKEAHHG